MTRPIAVLVLLALAAGCASGAGVDLTSPGKVRGRIEGVQGLPKGAYVQVLRVDGDGLPSPDPFERVTPDRIGRFTSAPLPPGRYRVVYRPPDAPPSSAVVRVPNPEPVRLRPVVAVDLVQLRVKPAGVGSVRCVLTEAAPPDGVADVREFECSDPAPAIVRGMRAGRWYLDVPDGGWTTEVDVQTGAPLRDLIVDPPAPSGTGGVGGQVRRLDGDGAAWVVVAARPVAGGADTASRWGRYVVTDRAGSYQILGIPPGPALVRVECRQWRARILPAGRTVTIPPSGMIDLGFVLEP